MAPPSWADSQQLEFLSRELPSYIKAREDSSKTPLKRYWEGLEARWFAEFPVEANLGLPLPLPKINPLRSQAVPLTSEQTAALATETQKYKDRLKAWMRYRDRLRAAGVAPTVPAGSTKKMCSLFLALRQPKTTRPIRDIETYQTMFREKIRGEVMNRGYGDLNEEAEAERTALAESIALATLALATPASSSAVMTEEELQDAELIADNLSLQRVLKNRSQRMSLYRVTSVEMYEGESDEIKSQVEAATAKANAERDAGKDRAEDDASRTPLEFQHGIDQLGAVFSKVHEAVMQETGWFGMTFIGGPMPRRGGQISTKTICFGETPNKHLFSDAHPNFEADIKVPFNQFLKRAFPHDVRDARGFPAPGVPDGVPIQLDEHGLISMPNDDEEQETPQVLHAPPKRIRRAKQTPAATTSASSPSFPVLPGDTRSPPSPTFLPDNYDEIMTDFLPNYTTSTAATVDSTPSASGTESFTLNGYCLNTVNALLDFNAQIEYGQATGSGGDERDTLVNAQFTLESLPQTQIPSVGRDGPQSVLPQPRPIHAGAAFAPDRILGGSPAGARKATVEVNGYNFPTSSTLLQRLTTQSTAGASSSQFTFGRGSSSDFHFNAESPSNTQLPSTPTTGVSSGRTQAPSKPSALQAFTSVVIDATAAVTAMRDLSVNPTPVPTPPTPAPPITLAPSTPPAPVLMAPTPASPNIILTPSAPAAPQYIQSRPPANLPKGHHLASAVPKTVAKKAAGGRRARPRTASSPTEPSMSSSSAAAPGQGAAPTPSATMTAAARAETDRVNREAAALQRQSAATRARAKAMEEQTEAVAETARRQSARLHNPDGQHDLIVTTVPRPKRNTTATLNFDGTLRVPKKSMHAALDIGREKEEQEIADKIRNGKRKAPGAAAGASSKK
ncbi:hypothetical protein C8F04DRAFT_1250202 [Mycena alexandri]|uniref:Uncharacterized protein n=1 Tax=Mycena alexandri TaxID=1745969 RepID=A0AAD6TFI8_9AGAR|nr:hypothetical protein C8F04DRAFT_1250202 [Mycena alexandri]